MSIREENRLPVERWKTSSVPSKHYPSGPSPCASRLMVLVVVYDTI